MVGENLAKRIPWQNEDNDYGRAVRADRQGDRGGQGDLRRALEALDGGADIRGIDFGALAARAEDQRDRVEDLRVRAAREALSGESAA